MPCAMCDRSSSGVLLLKKGMEEAKEMKESLLSNKIGLIVRLSQYYETIESSTKLN